MARHAAEAPEHEEVQWTKHASRSDSRSAPDAILPGHWRAPQWVPARTPTVHWGPVRGEAVGGPQQPPKG